jgi:hypothetical protein
MKYKPLTYLAPGAAEGHAMYMPGARAPRIDEHAVTPETREELIGGRAVQVAPADAPHGDRHFRLDYLLAAHLAPAYEGSTDLLTRTSNQWNFAADASVRKAGVDPGTGGRYLEELAFEIKHTQRLRDLEERARQLVSRGVRRVFVICVEKGEHGQVQVGPVLEWSAARDQWLELGADAVIEDECLAVPLPVRALLAASASTDDVVVRALAAKDNPALREYVQEGYVKGVREGFVEGVRDLCEALDIELTPEREARLAAMEAGELRGLRAVLKAERRWPG